MNGLGMSYLGRQGGLSNERLSPSGWRRLFTSVLIRRGLVTASLNSHISRKKKKKNNFSPNVKFIIKLILTFGTGVSGFLEHLKTDRRSQFGTGWKDKIIKKQKRPINLTRVILGAV